MEPGGRGPGEKTESVQVHLVGRACALEERPWLKRALAVRGRPVALGPGMDSV